MNTYLVKYTTLGFARFGERSDPPTNLIDLSKNRSNNLGSAARGIDHTDCNGHRVADLGGHPRKVRRCIAPGSTDLVNVKAGLHDLRAHPEAESLMSAYAHTSFVRRINATGNAENEEFKHQRILGVREV
jgi:hypothetical protein